MYFRLHLMEMSPFSRLLKYIPNSNTIDSFIIKCCDATKELMESFKWMCTIFTEKESDV